MQPPLFFFYNSTIPRSLRIFFLFSPCLLAIRANSVRPFAPKMISELADLDFTNPAPPHLAGVTIFSAAVDPFVVYPIPASVSQCVDQISPASIAPFELQEQTKKKCGSRGPTMMYSRYTAVPDTQMTRGRSILVVRATAHCTPVQARHCTDGC